MPCVIGPTPRPIISWTRRFNVRQSAKAIRELTKGWNKGYPQYAQSLYRGTAEGKVTFSKMLMVRMTPPSDLLRCLFYRNETPIPIEQNPIPIADAIPGFSICPGEAYATLRAPKKEKKTKDCRKYVRAVVKTVPASLTQAEHTRMQRKTGWRKTTPRNQ